MDGVATERFNQLLKEWRREGRKIGWEDLNRAARIAREEQEERRAEQKEAEEAERAMRNQEGERTCG